MPLIYPVTTEKLPAHMDYEQIVSDFYSEIASTIASHLDRGQDVAVIAEGDPFFYGSFMYIHDRLADQYETEVVPGVCSVLGASAVLGAPLVYRNQTLSVLSGVMSAEELTRRLADTGAAAIMKLGKTSIRFVLFWANSVSWTVRSMLSAPPWPISALCRSPKSMVATVPISQSFSFRGKMERRVIPAILVLGEAAVPAARRIASVLERAEVRGLQNRVASLDETFVHFGDAVRSLYEEGRPIIALCAAGIIIRALAPLLHNKRVEPPVLAVAEDGSAVVPLLGGLSGVNDMARQIAAARGCACRNHVRRTAVRYQSAAPACRTDPCQS